MKKRIAILPVLGFMAAVCTMNAQDPANTPKAGAGNSSSAPITSLMKPETMNDRLMNYAIVTVSPEALVIPLFPAAFDMAFPPDAYPRSWKDGAGAFGRNYGDSLANQTSRETAKFLVAAMLREDTRYHPSMSRNAMARSFHALAFTFVDKSESGGNRLAVANFVGAGAGGFVGNLYLPPGFDNVSHAETRTEIAFAVFVAQNLFKEFTPEVNRALHKLHLPAGTGSGWWTKGDN